MLKINLISASSTHQASGTRRASKLMTKLLTNFNLSSNKSPKLTTFCSLLRQQRRDWRLDRNMYMIEYSKYSELMPRIDSLWCALSLMVNRLCVWKLFNRRRSFMRNILHSIILLCTLHLIKVMLLLNFSGKWLWRVFSYLVSML